MGSLRGSPEVPCSPGKRHVTAELRGHGAMAAGLSCPVSRGATDPRAAEAWWRSKAGDLVSGISCVHPQTSPCPGTDTAVHPLNPRRPLFVQVSADRACEARGKQDSPKGETPSCSLHLHSRGRPCFLGGKCFKQKTQQSAEALVPAWCWTPALHPAQSRRGLCTFTGPSVQEEGRSCRQRGASSREGGCAANGCVFLKKVDCCRVCCAEVRSLRTALTLGLASRQLRRTLMDVARSPLLKG